MSVVANGDPTTSPRGGAPMINTRIDDFDVACIGVGTASMPGPVAS
ncbi:MAG: hypothetical protein ACK5OX_11620 [Desertimonas sp.]